MSDAPCQACVRKDLINNANHEAVTSWKTCDCTWPADEYVGHGADIK